MEIFIYITFGFVLGVLTGVFTFRRERRTYPYDASHEEHLEAAREIDKRLEEEHRNGTT